MVDKLMLVAVAVAVLYGLSDVACHGTTGNRLEKLEEDIIECRGDLTNLERRVRELEERPR